MSGAASSPVERRAWPSKRSTGTRRSTRRRRGCSRRRDFSRAPTWSAVATTASMTRSMSTALARKRRQVGGRRVVVVVQRDVVDERRSSARGPSPPRRRRSASALLELPHATSSIARVDAAASPGRSRRRAGRTRAAVLWPICQGPSSSLPRHQTLDVVRLLGAVRPAQVGQRGAARGGCSTRAGRRPPARRGCRG